MTNVVPFDVLIIGAGPAGLAAAIAAKRLGVRSLVIEKGALVNSLLHFPVDMAFFTTPELLEIGGVPFVSPHEKPTRQEALRYYRRVTDSFALDVAFDETVQSIIKRRDDTFVVVTRAPRLQSEARTRFVEATRERGGDLMPPTVEREARCVVIATGAYDVANQIDIPGEDLPHVSHYYREPHPFYRKRVVIIGGKNSAAEAALDLFRNGVHVTLVHRGAALGESIKYWVKPDIDNRIKEGSIPARFSSRPTDITAMDIGVEGPGGAERLPADAVLLMTGYRSDTALLRSAGVTVDDEDGTAVHHPETFETNVPNLFLAGAVIAGRNSGRIFIENGRLHGELVIREIARRLGRTA